MTEKSPETTCCCLLGRIMSDVRSTETYQHFLNARREMLLAAKCVIEGLIQRLEEKSQTGPAKARKVDVE